MNQQQLNRRIPSMLQPIKIFCVEYFDRIPLYKQIFSPFLSLELSSIRKTATQQLKKYHEFKNLEVALNQKADCSYIWGYNQYILDIFYCTKNIRVRFILHPLSVAMVHNQKQNKSVQKLINTNIKIVDNTLIIISGSSIYIHDLIFHKSRLFSTAFEQNKQHAMRSGVLRIGLNHYYIHRVCVIQAMRPMISVQIYGINLFDNFDVVLCVNKLIRIGQFDGQIASVSISQCQGVLYISLKIINNQDNLCFVEILKIQLIKNQNMLYSRKNEYRIQNKIDQTLYFIIEKIRPDSIITNQCPLLLNSHYHESIIRGSWLIDRKSVISNQNRQSLIEQQKNLKIVSNNIDFLLFYQKGLEYFFIMTGLDTQPKTSVIQHNQPEKAIVVDQSMCMWEYDLTKQETIYLANPSLVLNFANLLKQQMSNNQCMIFHNSSTNKLVVKINNTFYALHKSFFYPKISTQNYEIHSNTSCTFLSVQSQDYSTINNLYVSQSNSDTVVQHYIDWSSNQRYFNIRKYFTSVIFPYLHQNLSVSRCKIIRQQQVLGTVQLIINKLQCIKPSIFETEYDCDTNKFYWAFCNLFNKLQTQNDTKYIILELIQENPQKGSHDILTILFTESLFKKYLANKCKNKQSQKIPCTTIFFKCKLILGCSCVYKRLYRYFSLISLYQINEQSHFDFKTLKKQQTIRKQIVNILKASQNQKYLENQSNCPIQLKLILDKKQEQIREKFRKQKAKKIQDIDKKWQSQFNTQEKLPQIVNDQDFYQYTTIKRPKIQKLQVTYKKSDQEIDILFKKLSSIFAQDVIACNINLDILKSANHPSEYETITQEYLQKIQLICQKYNIYSYKSITINLQLNREQQQQKLAMCVILIHYLYSFYVRAQKIQHPLCHYQQSRRSNLQIKLNLNTKNQQNQQTIISKKTHIYQRVWKTIYWLVKEAIQLKYTENQGNKKNATHLKTTLNTLNEIIIKQKQLPPIVPNLIKLSRDQTLTNNQLQCILETIIKIQIYKNENSALIGPLQKYKSKYHKNTWENGILKLNQIHEFVKHKLRQN